MYSVSLGNHHTPFLDFSSGYVQRAREELPQQGARRPWRVYQNYVKDMLAIRHGRIDDGVLRFGRKGVLPRSPPPTERRMTTIRQADHADASLVAPLFDAYRQFYGKPADPETALRFIEERLANNESTIFVAIGDNGEALGFTQLYPSFSSVSAGRVYILNDLFVAPQARRGAVGRGLLEAAARFGRSQGALRLSLSTARSNAGAQALYESGGWVRDEQYYDYSLKL